MYQALVHTYGNIISYQDTISYFYKIKPINTLFASQQSTEDLVESLFAKIAAANMPGQIVIRPKQISATSILKYYEECYRKHGQPELLDLKNAYIQDLKKQLAKAIRYRYEIFFVFVQGRTEINKRIFTHVSRGKAAPLEKYVLDSAKVVEEILYKQLSENLTVDKLNDAQSGTFLQYLQIPTESHPEEFYVEPKPRLLKYSYKDERYEKEMDLYTKTLIATKLPTMQGTNRILNDIQTFEYPVDIIIKFDLEPTKQFAQNMSAKKHQIDKDTQKHMQMYGYYSAEFQKEKMLAIAGEKSLELGEDSKAKWQLMFRIRANDEEMMEKRTNHLRKYLEKANIETSYKIGRQEALRNNLIPFDVTFSDHVFSTDVRFLCGFNLLGGLFIGEEEKGLILTGTASGGLPVLTDPLATIKGDAKNTANTVITCGESGGGKSQLVNHNMLQNMIFFGMKVLCIDPKGDRYKLCRQLGQHAANIVLGSDDAHAGMFDPFILYEDSALALERAKQDVLLLVRSVNNKLQVNLYNIDIAHDAMLKKLKRSKKKQRATLRLLSEELVCIDELLGQTLLSLSKNRMAKLFFANQEYSFAFDFSKQFNLITFADVPNLQNFDSNNIEHQMFALLLSKTEQLIMTFLRADPGQPKITVIDEYKIWKATSHGSSTVENINRITRSMMNRLYIIAQSFSDIEEGILQNSSEFFIGNLKSNEEINKVLHYFSLEDNVALKDQLIDRTKSEGVREEKKFNFLYVDYNNRKCMTKLNFLDLFKDSFDTHYQDKETTYES